MTHDANRIPDKRNSFLIIVEPFYFFGHWIAFSAFPNDVECPKTSNESHFCDALFMKDQAAFSVDKKQFPILLSYNISIDK
jgi:hypothetical protein